jgi:hypothetical protein
MNLTIIERIDRVMVLSAISSYNNAKSNVALGFMVLHSQDSITMPPVINETCNIYYKSLLNDYNTINNYILEKPSCVIIENDDMVLNSENFKIRENFTRMYCLPLLSYTTNSEQFRRIIQQNIQLPLTTSKTHGNLCIICNGLKKDHWAIVCPTNIRHRSHVVCAYEKYIFSRSENITCASNNCTLEHIHGRFRVYPTML